MRGVLSAVLFWLLFAVIYFRNKYFSGQGKRSEREQLTHILAKALAPIGDGEDGVASSSTTAGIAPGQVVRDSTE